MHTGHRNSLHLSVGELIAFLPNSFVENYFEKWKTNPFPALNCSDIFGTSDYEAPNLITLLLVYLKPWLLKNL